MNIKKKIKLKKITVGIVGLGYVGLPLAYSFIKNDIKVFGFDKDKEKIKKLNQGQSYINYFKNNHIKFMLKKNFKCFLNFTKISEVDIIILCLPTPIYKNKSPDLSFIKNTMIELQKYLRPYQTLSLESTTYPGTCREIIYPYIKKKFKVGKNFFLVYSPEREDPGNKKYSILKIPKVIGGYSKQCLEIGSNYYSLLKIKMIKVSTLEVAELTKLLENIYRSVNIGMVNEMKNLCNKMKINIFEVINAAKSKPFGFHAFYPGPGYGGHCIPVDPFLLSWKAKSFNMKTKFIELSGRVNEQMPGLICKKISSIHKKFKIKPKIIIVGVAYKKNVDDIRESPALKIMDILNKKKIKYDYLDPFVSEIKNTRQIKTSKTSINKKYNLLSNYTLTVIVTDHDILNYSKILKYSNLILDARGRYAFNKSDKIIQI